MHTDALQYNNLDHEGSVLYPQHPPFWRWCPSDDDRPSLDVELDGTIAVTTHMGQAARLDERRVVIVCLPPNEYPSLRLNEVWDSLKGV